MKIIAIIQARMSSERLPGKVIKHLNSIPMIVQIYRRAVKAVNVDKVIVATSLDKTDDALADVCRKYGVPVFRGSLSNVLERFFKCATQENADVIVRLTGDNALIDPALIDKAVAHFKRNELDYLNYCKELPLGMSAEVFSYSALAKAYEETDDMECKEHVTLYMYGNGDKFKWEKYSDEKLEDHSDIRLTVDTKEDFELISLIYSCFKDNEFDYNNIIDLLRKNPDWRFINKNIKQKEILYYGEENKI